MRDNRIQHLKTLLLLGVVINHAWAGSQYITTDQIPPLHVVSWFSNVFIISGLPVFFFLSGYFAGKRFEEFLTWGGYKTLMKKKIMTLAVPYLLWNAIFIAFYLAVGSMVPRIGQRVASFHLNTFYGCFDKLLGLSGSPLDAPLWFIRDLFILFLLVPLIVVVMKYAKWLLYIGFIALLLASGFIYEKWYSAVLFTFGLDLGRRRFDLYRFESLRWYAVPTWIIGSIGVYISMVAENLTHANPRILIWFYLITPVAWIGMLRWIRFKDGGLFERFLTPAAFYIYASHFLFCSMVLHSVAGKVPDSPFKLLILYSVFIFGGGFIILSTVTVLRRFTPRLLSLLAGGRMS